MDYVEIYFLQERLVEEGVTFWGESPRMVSKFQNKYGGDWSDADALWQYECEIWFGCGRTAIELDWIKLMSYPDPPMLLVEGDETDGDQIHFTWMYPEDKYWTVDAWHWDWDEPLYFDYGSEITHYSIYWYDDSKYEHSRIDRQELDLEYDVDSVYDMTLSWVKGNWYTIAMTATNEFGESHATEEVHILQAEVPAEIVNGETAQVTAFYLDSEYKKNFMRLRWFDSDDGGSDILGYKVLIKNVNGTYHEYSECMDLKGYDYQCYVDIQDLNNQTGDFGIPWGEEVFFKVVSWN